MKTIVTRDIFSTPKNINIVATWIHKGQLWSETVKWADNAQGELSLYKYTDTETSGVFSDRIYPDTWPEGVFFTYVDPMAVPEELLGFKFEDLYD